MSGPFASPISSPSCFPLLWNWSDRNSRLLKAATALIVGAITFVALVPDDHSTSNGPPMPAPARDLTFKTLGQQMLTRYFLVFELISLLLAVAIIGAIDRRCRS